MSKPLGGKRVWYAEQMSHQFVPFGYGDWALYAEREATLSDDLLTIEERRLRHFRLIGRDTDLQMSRSMAVWLHEALGRALEATKRDPEMEQ